MIEPKEKYKRARQYNPESFPNSYYITIEDYEGDQKWFMSVGYDSETGRVHTTFALWTLNADNIWDLFYKINERVKTFSEEYKLY